MIYRDLKKEQYYAKLMAPFVQFWNTDDPEWVEQRDVDWDILKLHHDSGDQGYENYEAYFKTGVCKGYIDEITKFLMSPLPSNSAAFDFFMSDNFSDYNKQNLMDSYFAQTTYASGFPWYRQHAQYFAEGVFGSKYRIIEYTVRGRTKVVSPEPTFWSMMFPVAANKFLQKKIPFTGMFYLVDYFSSALTQAVDIDHRKHIKLNELFVTVDDALAKAAISEEMRQFAEALKAKEEIIRANWALNAHLDS